MLSPLHVSQQICDVGKHFVSFRCIVFCIAAGDADTRKLSEQSVALSQPAHFQHTTLQIVFD